MATDETSPAPEAGFGMTDLEESLRGPEGSATRREALLRLDGMAERVRSRIGRGIQAAEFERTNALANAITAATHILSRTGN
ncbi:EscE/YscE/SsaE family type III secretion system needle protein co-chaperone [uncultured Methylobacterium sp.]|uniref:EscE/YscE/SsaE family type III secretion system needle protein co-chaperone n=1 Tax=uncultured Methylobacterium sp. TaxID=157278 RepID=UPI0035CB5AAB